MFVSRILIRTLNTHRLWFTSCKSFVLWIIPDYFHYVVRRGETSFCFFLLLRVVFKITHKSLLSQHHWNTDRFIFITQLYDVCACVCVCQDFSLVTEVHQPSENSLEGVQASVSNYKVHWNTSRCCKVFMWGSLHFYWTQQVSKSCILYVLYMYEHLWCVWII